MKTKDTKFTPGPWHWQYSPMSNLPVALATEKRDVLLSTGDDQQAWAEVSDADRHLIGAAPDLFAALQACVATMETALDYGDFNRGKGEFAKIAERYLNAGIAALQKASAAPSNAKGSRSDQ